MPDLYALFFLNASWTSALSQGT
ncbi:protein of unknown function [Burkholderia multivorans]